MSLGNYTLFDLELLLKKLDELFPDKCPNLQLDEKTVWYKAGERAAVNAIIEMKQGDWKALYEK